MIALAIGLGAAAKTEFVKRTNVAIAALATAIFVINIYRAVVLAFDHRGFWALTVLFCFVSIVFYLGAILVCNQSMKFENGGVILKKGGLLYRMIYVKPMGMEKLENLTLCSISWLGALVIVFYPIIYLLGHVVCAALAVIGFVVFAQNPLLQNRYWHEFATENSCYKKFWQTLYMGPMPFSPVLIAILVAVFGAAAWGLVHIPRTGWWLLLDLLAALVLISLAAIPISYLAAFVMDSADQKERAGHLETRTQRVSATQRAIGAWLASPITALLEVIGAALEPLFALWGTLKKNACPKIIIKD
jgi:hypothetical protein